MTDRTKTNGSSEVAEKATRRRFDAAYKLRVLGDAERCKKPGEMGELLRREGLYQNNLKRYDDVAKEASIKALGQMHPGKKRLHDVPVEQYELLKRDFAIQEKTLAALTVEFMALKKKVNGE